jgi:hypothetical protein
MPITFRCSCGKTLQVKDEFASRRVKCPACSGVAVVPAARPAFEVVEDEPPAPQSRPAVAARPAVPVQPARKPQPQEEEFDPGFSVVDDEDEKPKKKVAARSRHDDEDDDDDRPRRRRRDEDDDDDDDDGPRGRRRDRYKSKVDDDESDLPPEFRKKVRKAKEKAEKKKKHDHLAFEKAVINSGVPGGIAAMVVAVLWFTVAVMNDWYPWYPPILFVLGVIALVKGLMKKDDDDD